MTFKVDKGAVAILAIEDDVLGWMIATEILVDAGFCVIEAHDSQEAVTLLETRSDVQVMVTDSNMSAGSDGFGLSRLVRKRWPSVGVVVTSSKMQPSPGDLSIGVQFISKPYRPADLVEKIAIVLRSSTEVSQSTTMIPKGVVAHSPVMAEISGVGMAAAQPEPDKT